MKYYKSQVGLDLELIEKINNFSLDNNIKTFSKSVRKLVNYGLDYINIVSLLENNKKSINKLKNKIDYNTKLIKQIYSDLELSYHTNINKNKELKEFDREYYRRSIDE